MYLQQLNPSIKALTIVVTVLLLALVFDPITPLLYATWSIMVIFLLGKVQVKRFFLYFIPFFIIAFGMLWTTVLFADQPSNAVDVVRIWGWSVPRETLLTAFSLALRVLSFATLSLLFILTTNPTSFILSLMQQCKLPPKLAYGILAGYRFLPLMKDEFIQVRSAHRIRGVNQANGWKEYLLQFQRYSIPLLAGAIRKAERTAIAMESKGFTGSRNRTYYRQYSVGLKDWLFLIIMVVMFFVFAYLSWSLGYFRWYNGEL